MHEGCVYDVCMMGVFKMCAKWVRIMDCRMGVYMMCVCDGCVYNMCMMGMIMMCA